MDKQEPESTDMQRVFDQVPARRRASADTTERVYAATLATFEGLPRNSRPARWHWAVAAGLALLGISLVTWINQTPGDAAAAIAHIDFASGSYRINDSEAASPASEDGRELSAGTRLTTGPTSRLKLRIGQGVEVRLDHDSSTRLINSKEIEVLAGRIYVDVWKHDRAFTVQSGSAEIRRTGTQFTVERRETDLTVAVREGSIELDDGALSLAATAKAGNGERIRVVDGRLTERTPISRVDSAEWSWIAAADQGFDPEGRTLYDFLWWAARETGRTLVLDKRSERAARLESTLAWGRTPITAQRLEDYLAAAAIPLSVDTQAPPWELRIVVQDALPQ